MRIPRAELRDFCISVIERTQRLIDLEIEGYPQRAFATTTVRGKRRSKRMVGVDLFAEKQCEVLFHRKYGTENVYVVGEESLIIEEPDLTTEQRLVVLVDMIDGTDLLQRGLSNWCSAMILYKQGHILGAFVGIPNDGIYFAFDVNGAYKKPPGKKKPIRLAGPARSRTLSGSSVCFYGQKARSFLSVAEHRGFARFMKQTALRRQDTLRIYTLAGNPMMAKLAEGIIDAVFDVRGQSPHDVAPGAFIAMQAGAIFTDLRHRSISLEKMLARPGDDSSRLRYIISANRRIHRSLIAVLRK